MCFLEEEKKLHQKLGAEVLKSETGLQGTQVSNLEMMTVHWRNVISF